MRFILSSLILLSILSCGKDSPETVESVITFNLTVTSSTGGKVSSSGGPFETGSNVSITATPDSEYVFVNWSNGSTDNPLSVTVNSNQTITPNFEKRKYPLSLNIVGEGRVLEEIVNSARSTDYESGSTVKLTAIPSEGWVFVGWSGAVESNELEVQVLVNEDKEVKGEFYLKLPDYERYSSINETTSTFLRQKYFYRYLSYDEYRSIKYTSIEPNGDIQLFVNGRVSGSEFYQPHGSYDTWGDFNNDGKLDYFAPTWKFMSDGSYGNEKSAYIFIDNYFMPEHREYKSIKSDYINWAAPTSIADFDNDGYMDVWVPQWNRHNNYTGLNHDSSHPNYGISVEPGKGTIVFFGPNNEMTEIQVGPFLDCHSSSTGDIDNDGDVDIILFPVGNPREVSPSPKILINNGARNFETIELLKNHNNFFAEYPYAWEALQFNVFDLDGDGNLDIFGSNRLKGVHRREVDPYWEYNDNSIFGFHNNNKPWILWGTNDVQYDSENLYTLDKKIDRADEILTMNLPHFRVTNSLGSGFTDFDSDGDIDIILSSTVGYENYELTLFENKGNRVFEDVTDEKIDFYYNMEKSKYGEFYFIAMIDKDGDGDFDIVPYGAGVSFGGVEFIKNLYWENRGGKFVRRELD